MAHVFDTLLATPQRTLIRRAVLQRLAPLTRASGLYLEALEGYPSAITSPEDAAELYTLFNGRAPAVLVACGRKTYDPRSVTGEGDRYTGELVVDIIVVNQHARSPLARVEADVVADADVTKDPGTEVILEHTEELLIAADFPTSEDSVAQLRPEVEEEVWHNQEITVWRQSYRVEVARILDHTKGLGGMQQMLATVRDDGAPAADSFTEKTPSEDPSP